MATDLDQLYTALRAADKAGDTEGAAKLAAYIHSVNEQDAKPQRVPPTLQVQSPSGSPAAQPNTFVDRVVHGVFDPIHGGAQLLSHALPDSVMDEVTKANNWLADKTGNTDFLKRIPERSVSSLVTGQQGGIDQMVAERERQYQAERAAAGSTGYDWGRFIGSTISPANVAVSRLIPGGGSMLARAGSGALGGMTLASLSPTSGAGDFWAEKGTQVGLGGLAGAAAPAIAGAAARVIRPNTSANVNALLDAGVKLTPGQILGGGFKRLEDAATSVPFLGDFIKGAQRKSVESFNEASINRALEPIGEKLPKGLSAGREAVEYAADKVGDAYDRLLPQMHGQLDPQLKTEIAGVQALGRNLPAAQRGQLDRLIKSEITDRFTSGGRASGETLKMIESELGKSQKIFQRSEDYDTRKLGDAVQELQASMRRMFERVNPGKAQELAKVNTAYANLVRVQDAAGRMGAKDGVFSPSQLAGAVRKADPSKAKSAYARGNALMQDLSDPANAVLPPSIGDSGTATRAMVSLGLLGEIGKLSTGLSAALPYTSAGLIASRLALASRPQAANALSQLTRQSGPALTPALVGGVETAQRP